MTISLVISGAIIVLFIGLTLWRGNDRRAERQIWRELFSRSVIHRTVFSEELIAGLPEPVQRYFRYSIQPGTLLKPVAEIEMTGELGVGSRQDPRYHRMQARQLLAPPYGLIWRVKSGGVSGSDAMSVERSWTRFWLFGLIPIVRVGGDADHYRSAFGRVIAEGLFWTPAAFLTLKNVQWEAVDTGTIRATVPFGEFAQAVDISISADGQPTRVLLQRWSNANSDKKYRLQSFGGYLSDFREYDGYTLPTRVEGGNLIATNDYFPFYKANVSAIHLT